jgi:hypothetical protein
LALAREGNVDQLLPVFEQHLDSAVRDLRASRAEQIGRTAAEGD